MNSTYIKLGIDAHYGSRGNRGSGMCLMGLEFQFQEKLGRSITNNVNLLNIVNCIVKLVKEVIFMLYVCVLNHNENGLQFKNKQKRLFRIEEFIKQFKNSPPCTSLTFFVSLMLPLRALNVIMFSGVERSPSVSLSLKLNDDVRSRLLNSSCYWIPSSAFPQCQLFLSPNSSSILNHHFYCT